MIAAAFETVPREQIYEITGLQFLPFNTIYQLLALNVRDRRCSMLPRPC